MDTYGVSIRVFALGLFVMGFAQTSWAQDQNHGGGGGQDLLDDQSEVGYQEAVNGVLNTYNPQIAQLQIQKTALEADKAQCIIDMKQQQAEAQSEADQAKAQALQSMLGPGMQTMGSMMEGMGGGAEKESERLDEEMKLLMEECDSQQGLRCSNGRVSFAAEECNTNATTGVALSDAEKQTCVTTAQTMRREFTRDAMELEREGDEVDEAGHGLMEGIAGLAAAGIGGNIASKAAQKGAAARIANAAEAEKICQMRIESQAAGLDANIAQLQQQKARDLTMARMSAEFATQQRRKAADLQSNEDDEVNDNPVAIADPLQFPEEGDGPVKVASGDVLSAGGSGGGGGLPAGGPPGGGGAAGGDSGWVFGGGGGGFDGGNTLPPQSTAGGFSTAGGKQGIITPGKGNGFGSGFAKFNDDEAKSAGEEVIGVGDGGLRVLMARTSLIMAKHSPTLMKSLNFDKLAKRAEERGREAASVNADLKNGLK